MTQLAYHPAFDAYNAILRIIRILLSVPQSVDSQALRILDFYLVFPETLVSARLTSELRTAVRKLASKPRFPYDKVPSSKALFARMESPHEAARQTLISKGFVVFDVDGLSLSRSSTPQELLDLASEQNQNEEGLMAFLSALGQAFPINGPNGLKDRSGLLEYRYDVV